MNVNFLYVDIWVFDYVYEYLEWYNFINDFLFYENFISVIYVMVCWVVWLL